MGLDIEQFADLANLKRRLLLAFVIHALPHYMNQAAKFEVSFPRGVLFRERNVVRIRRSISVAAHRRETYKPI